MSDSPAAAEHRASWLARTLVSLGNLHRRVLAAVLSLLGPRVAYAFLGGGAGLMYRLLEPLRQRSEGQLRAALGDSLRADEIAHVARESFVHRGLNLADLMLARRWLTPRTMDARGVRIPEQAQADLAAAAAAGRPVILLTGYYGAFDLLPVVLGLNGLRAVAVYRPHANAGYDAFRTQVRCSTGSELVPVERAMQRVTAVMEAGGVLALLADHHVERGGLAMTFLGLPTHVPRAVALLAQRYQADVIVAGLRRVGRRFQFELIHEETIRAGEVGAPAGGEGGGAADSDAVQREITGRYLAALERMIRRDPTQYLWLYARWGAEHAAAVAGERG